MIHHHSEQNQQIFVSLLLMKRYGHLSEHDDSQVLMRKDYGIPLGFLKQFAAHGGLQRCLEKGVYGKDLSAKLRHSIGTIDDIKEHCRTCWLTLHDETLPQFQGNVDPTQGELKQMAEHRKKLYRDFDEDLRSYMDDIFREHDERIVVDDNDDGEATIITEGIPLITPRYVKTQMECYY